MFEELIEKIKEYDSIVIFGHVRPDGDCFGAQVGLKEIIKDNFINKKVYITGSGLQEFFDLLDHMDIIDDKIISSSLAIMIDSSSLDRYEDQRFVLAKEKIKIDHHIKREEFDGLSYVIESANSTCSIIVDIVKEQKLKLNKKASTALLLGNITDTGRFQFGNNFSKMFLDASYLIEHDADMKAILDILNMSDENIVRFKGYIYSHYQKTQKGTIYLILDKNTLKQLNISFATGNEMVNTIGNIKGYPIWVFFTQNDDDSVHIEFRSNKYIVEPIASKRGGGGHAHACGCTVDKLDDNLVKEILKECDDLIK